MRWLGFMAIIVGLLLATPMGLVLVASAGGKTNLAVVAPSLAWLFWTVPSAALVGVILLIVGLWLVFIAPRRHSPSVG